MDIYFSELTNFLYKLRQVKYFMYCIFGNKKFFNFLFFSIFLSIYYYIDKTIIFLAWQSRQTEKKYDLGSLWLCLEHHEKQSSTGQYYSEVTALKLQLVSPVDKEEIINYFTGKIENSECINQELA
jgi:hypothetical protein